MCPRPVKTVKKSLDASSSAASGSTTAQQPRVKRPRESDELGKSSSSTSPPPPHKTKVECSDSSSSAASEPTTALQPAAALQPGVKRPRESDELGESSSSTSPPPPHETKVERSDLSVLLELMVYLRQKKYPSMCVLLPQLKDINLTNHHGHTLLIAAAYTGSAGLVEHLLRQYHGKIDLNIRDGKGWSALRISVWKGHVGIVKLLLNSGADFTDRVHDDLKLYTLAYHSRSSVLMSYFPSPSPVVHRPQASKEALDAQQFVGNSSSAEEVPPLVGSSSSSSSSSSSASFSSESGLSSSSFSSSSSSPFSSFSSLTKEPSDQGSGPAPRC